MLDSIQLYSCDKYSGLVEQKRPKTSAIFPLESNPRSLLTSVSVRFSVHTTQESVTKTYQICDDSFSRPKERSITSVQNLIDRSEIGVFSVNESPIRQVFGADTRGIRYNVDIA